jgi:hypothetical protein
MPGASADIAATGPFPNLSLAISCGSGFHQWATIVLVSTRTSPLARINFPAVLQRPLPLVRLFETEHPVGLLQQSPALLEVRHRPLRAPHAPGWGQVWAARIVLIVPPSYGCSGMTGVPVYRVTFVPIRQEQPARSLQNVGGCL